MKLPVFPSLIPPVANYASIACQNICGVRRVVNFVLGPEGTNMQQACKAWIRWSGIVAKAEIMLCPTPEDSLAQARLVTEKGVVPFFWTCAVYFRLNELFFGNPDVHPFLVSFNYELDKMQLCVKEELHRQEWNGGWRIASHPSPSPLVDGLGPVVKTTSNAQAALMCARGEVEACITTAQAAKIHGLTMVHEFGSPIMVFFAGTTEHGMKILLGQ
ncbi:MAG: hypothetical protein UT98_C0003G0076 [Candidatus Nomurabacteria bacterium GW2011_GWF2_40_31]|uniref:Prephenate dehydratase n=2 Tax=Candidatus Nomuraibacteriota TaxID=1752729 RepID=A0A837HRQ2_9BACT|nr:MAG: hypothetical protein UT27_C0013G0002 [Candidatus Nomurabacteria bacterium GW2011_GWD2_39_12]KKR20308.1 MAG: hypothetical protein UT51_C0005G0041 [Candidatus Nomurabacteria bacterium GW2011_GWC2_39_41]KKR36254.1 MAG: hypothetical protein UT70_C0019G0004 [Candidatus Nomurabacteria bacterium GW2011_GWE2_40_10]KKR38402.1 MAG: hypothetical protein UT73_C0003G0042 [Candidatus Nomurabacteria bacterium GW2011_GWB1_40_11]KKR39487.1 MAG: hypothetical protein UT74_C0012G0018 [Parcubacteria group b